MSLNFVSSTVLHTDDSGKQSEEIINNSETNNVRRNAINSGAGLFDQLRKQQEEKERANEEKRAAGLGVATLNEEDVSHVNAYKESLHRKRKAREDEERAELDVFARERADRKAGVVVVEADGGDEKKNEKKKAAPVAVAKEEVVPVMLKKRLKGEKKPKKTAEEAKKPEAVEKKSEVAEVAEVAEKKEAPGLGGLLAGYGSSSDSD
jgi:hypothetical protein